ncbi:hypothetical protein AB7M35_000752 [Amorphus suaedae]
MRALRLAGPVLILAGAMALAVGVAMAPPGDTLMTRWLLTRLLAPERLLPLVGLAIAIAMAGPRTFGLGLAAFALGAVAGFEARGPILAVLAGLPQAVAQDFMTGPILCLLAGLALVAGGRLRPVVTPVAALLGGVAAAIAVKVTDPSFHDPSFPMVGTAVVGWLVLSVSLTVLAFRRTWFAIGAPILGSWLLAIGLLYGGASFAQKPPWVAAPVQTPPAQPPSAAARDAPLFPETGDRTRDILNWGLDAPGGPQPAGRP